MSSEDRETVQRVQAGETEAFELLVEKYKRKTFRLAYSVLRDQEEALDVAQEAFVKAFRSLPKFKGDSAFYTWLFRITMNLALDRKRQRATRARSMGTDDVPPEEWERTAVATDPDPEAEATSAERRAQIARGLESLSEQHRSIIILSDIEGLSYREIAEVLAIPMGTVMSRLHNARKRLRDALGPGFLGALLALALLSGLAVSGHAQAPPPPGPVPQVCVYALVILASNAPEPLPGSTLKPTPPLRPPVGGGTSPKTVAPPPNDWEERPALRGGCGREVRLQPWVPRLREVFGFSTYEPMSAFETTMPVGMLQRFALPGGRELQIQPLAIRPPVVRVAVKIQRGPVTEIATIMDVPPRRPALIGGPPHGSGVLIIAIRSRVEP
ncbi:MAG TPA: sigma-70 family RNA polymerase sigma factor [Methylomirabilota bacterium]|nr:sigma-70 family RNA polymerase sigma factor [Methylomirabilota bacterium]